MRKRAPLLIMVLALVALMALVVSIVSMHLSSSVTGNDKNTGVTPTEPSLQFAAAGDFDNTPNTAAVLAKIAQSKSAFTLALGDLGYDSVASEQQWCGIVKNALGKTYPFQIIAGNHETEESSKTMNINRYAACLPNRLSNLDGLYAQQYFFDYGGLARFIMISPALTIDKHSYNYTRDSPDYIWLQNAIAEARTNQTPWIIVGMHKNCITIGEKSCEIGPDLLNLLIEKHVDLVLQGHEHAYMRSAMLVHNKNCSALTPASFSDACINTGEAEQNKTYRAGLGSVVAIVGTGGAPLRKLNLNSSQKLLFANYSGLGNDDTYGALIVKLSAKRLQANFEGTDTKTHDSFAIIK